MSSDSEAEQSRRGFLKVLGGLGLGGLATALYSKTAEAAPSGVFPVETDDPLERIRAERFRFTGRTSDPSSPDDGTMWYRSDL